MNPKSHLFLIGLDPEVRRSVWDTIARARGNRAILMTTHSMEEAEVCCQRIGIMAKGIMRCLGSPARLKSLYGSGYKLSINSSNFTASDKFLEEILPVNFCLISSFHSSRRYSFAPIGDQLAHIFDELVSKSASNGILSWGVSQTSLDEIFSAVISVEEASS
jgi:ABC-type multidrug transport system ATPase subunit